MNLLKLFGLGLFMLFASYPSEVHAADLDNNLDLVLVEDGAAVNGFVPDVESIAITAPELDPERILFSEPPTLESIYPTDVEVNRYKQDLDGVKNIPTNTLFTRSGTGTGTGAILYSNSPNPFSFSTTASVYVPEDQRIQIRVFDKLGNELYNEYRQCSKGLHLLEFNSSMFSRRGVLFYQVITQDKILTRTMFLGEPPQDQKSRYSST